ncbi:MAG: MFS transporter [Anaerovoracaceae bacterium]
MKNKERIENKDRITGKQWLVIFIAGLAGQLCWNIENQWFTTFVYDKISPDPSIISWMVGASAITSAVATVFFGTIGDRSGRRKPLMVGGYIIWGITVIIFGATEFLPKNSVVLAAVAVVFADCLMTFFGAMAHDAGYNPWTTDITNEHNRGKLGAVIAVLPVVATILGSLLFGNIIEAIDYFAFFMIIGAAMIVLGLFALVMVKDSPDLKPNKEVKGFGQQFLSFFSFSVLRENKVLAWVLAIFSVYFIGFNMYFSHLTNYFIYSRGFKEGMAGIIIGVGLLCAVPLTLVASRYIDRGSFSVIMYASVALTVVGLPLLTIAGTAANIIGMVLVGGGYMCIFQSLMILLKNLFPPEKRGQCEGLRCVFYILIPMCIGTPVGSAIIKSTGLEIINDLGQTGYSAGPTLFFIAAAWTLLSLVPITVYKKLGEKNV